MAADVVDDALRIFAEAVPNLCPAEALKIEQRLRAVWGGDRVYISKRTANGKAQALGEMIAAGVPIPEAITACGLSRRHGYRLLSKKWIVVR